MSDENIEKTFQVTDPARLTISNIRGSITISPGEAGVIEVKAIKHGNFDSGRYSVEMTQDSDSSVHVETRANDTLFGFLSHPPKVEYSVRVPQGIHLDASCVSSTLNVSGLKGVIKLKTVSGDIELASLSGSLKINGVSGDISGSHLEGVLEVGVVSGRVRLLESAFPKADATTVSGDLILQTPLSDGPYVFSSVSGDVRLLVPADTHCKVELNSVSGSIRSSLPATTLRVGHGLRVTQIQNGGVAVRLKSVSGGVAIEAEGVPAIAVPVTSPAPAPPIPPAPPVPLTPPVAPAPASLSTAEILQRIERGEMTVDEAIRLMKDQP
jgi:hypothetical protein